MQIKAVEKKDVLLSGIFLLMFTLFSWQSLAFYIRFDFNFILLLLVLPFVIQQKNNKKSIRYGIIAIALLLIYPVFKLSTIFFFGFVCALFFLYESRFGKLSSVPIFLVIVVSPFAISMSEVLGFEIRLKLTEIAAQILQFVDKDYHAQGNIITLGAQEFRVDPECMGLKTVLLSFFISLIFITYHQKNNKTNHSLAAIAFMLIITFALVVISNLFRIVLITFFKAPPETFIHEMIGIICFVIYVVLPLWFIIKNISGSKIKTSQKTEYLPANNFYYFLIAIVLLSIFAFYSFSTIDDKTGEEMQVGKFSLPYKEYKTMQAELGVMKVETENLLIYIKPASNFHAADHSPLICWKGSGYKMNKEHMVTISGKEIFFSELKLGKDILFTTWWYDSGTDKTGSQFRWRSQNLLHHDQYRLINVISHDEKFLLKETEKLLETNIFVLNNQLYKY